uniref:Uncharacterized protein n=1 Tax=Erpetoichthys calabaricus TaxID=27687 RepID=A0A8C4T1U3_ERPCA
MAEEYISQLQDELICCVCLDILKDPISLQCGHSFCKECINSLKSCLTCRASFCEIHIQPHQRGPAWINHRLVKPSRNLEKNFCTEHQKLLELFCRSDQMCICSQCGVTEHRGHDLVGLEAERAEKEAPATPETVCDAPSAGMKNAMHFITTNVCIVPSVELQMQCIFLLEMFLMHHLLA